jgi:L-ascorbate metabolism protein UlaG (beta-lactamase superfamily)
VLTEQAFPEHEVHGAADFKRWRQTKEKKTPPDPAMLAEQLPVRALDMPQLNAYSKIGAGSGSKMQVTWLSHATVLVQFEGWTIVTDPVFSECCAPFNNCITKEFRRIRPSPVDLKDLASTDMAVSFGALPHIDLVLISHNHYDHLDFETVKALAARSAGSSGSQSTAWFVPLGMKIWMENEAGIMQGVVEMDWSEEVVLRDLDFGPAPTSAGATKPPLLIACLPCQHWCARTPFDKNKCLWASWVVGLATDSAPTAVTTPAPAPAPSGSVAASGGGCRCRSRFYFAGDTGYCGDIFRSIGARYGPISCAAIPIGAYGAPREQFFHRTNHMDPAAAVATHSDVGAKKSVAVHWGTFQMTREPVMEPVKKLEEAIAGAIAAGGAVDFVALQHGETIEIDV